MSDLMSLEDARDILSRWKAEHQEALDLLSHKLAATNASLVETLRRAERAEAELAKLKAHAASAWLSIGATHFVPKCQICRDHMPLDKRHWKHHDICQTCGDK